MQSQVNLKNRKSNARGGYNLYKFSLGGLLLLGGLTWSLPGSTTDGLEVINDAPAPAAAPVTPAAPPAPVAPPAPRVVAPAPPAQARPVAPVAPRPAAVQSAPKPPKLAAPAITRPAPVSVQPTQIRQGLQKNSHIDNLPTGQTAATSPVSPPEVKFVPNNPNNTASPQSAPVNTRYPAARRQSAPIVRQRVGQVNPPTAIAPRRQRINSGVGNNNAPQRSRSPLNPMAIQTKANSLAIGKPVGSNQVFSLEPIVNRGLEIALAPLPEYTRATGLYSAPQMQMQPSQNSGTDLAFPVAGGSPITSAFGWRIHPISGQGRMHNGTDIGAPLGTPVLAAYDGVVSAAQWSGGYGLMVTLRHLDGTQESRYAHLSEIFVESGQEVARGEMIGRIGSTGFSTGPHLHFEWRHLTNDGWVAVDAGPHLQAALANLMEAQKYAQAPQQPES